VGVDCKLFVLEKFSGWETPGYVRHVFTLTRERGLWAYLEQPGKPWLGVQLPAGGHSRYSDRSGNADLESGYLFDDPYGAPLESVRGADLPPESVSQYPQNQTILKLIRERFPDHDVVVYWC